MLPPIIVEIAEVDGTTVEVPLGTLLVLATGRDAAVSGWSAQIADSAVASFVPGRDDGSATFNPGVEPHSVGVTEVVLRGGGAGAVLTFTLTVAPPAR
ncbi:hypothetical protein N1028_06220 [Herbiconiux sp. CPCC 203407]|uniref:Uncharacterized protein n=1 Tax=Herbiconiux oxytropis TaxID=2970915 RepID=A0AA41XFF7_9MICO|nr:hypothetical protein [Herbiconiux oxytropis]MCS5723717.1 hypothetical protein [Herbiconiux oxytropis]MCS5725488.1 hypothetical protein [Herbiconiux oxytropis]